MNLTRKLSARITLRWLDSLSANEQEKVFHLTNAVIAQDDTIGFAEPLSYLQGMAVAASLALDVRVGRRCVLVAETGQEFVGLVILTQNGLPNCKHIAELTRGIIHPRFRGQGILEHAF